MISRAGQCLGISTRAYKLAIALLCAMTVTLLDTGSLIAQIADTSLNSEQLASLNRMLESPNRQEVLQALDYMKQVPSQSSLGGRLKALAEKSPDSIVRGFARLLAADWGIAIEPAPVEFTIHDSTVRPAEYGSIDDSQHEANLIPVAPVARRPTLSSLNPQSPFWESTTSFESSLPADVSMMQELGTPGDDLNDGTFHVLSDTDHPVISLSDQSIRPQILDRPINAESDASLSQPAVRTGYFSYERDAPLGYTGASGVLTKEIQQSDHFVPIEDRWRIGFPAWDRYGTGHQREDDYPFQEGSLLDPYNQNVLKGDYPIIGQHTFLNLTAETLAIHEFRQTPTATTPFESTNDSFSAGFFGDPDQYFYAPYFRLTLDLFHGNAAFKPVDWKLRLMPIFNVNNLDVQELAIVNPDVRRGTNRLRDDFALEEWFIEAKLADIGPNYDFVSARVGSQFFVSDFRGFLFRDVNRAVRLFGTRLANRDQFNLVWFDQAEKDTNSELNTFDDRHQNVVILNYFRQDFVFPGYTAQASFHYNHDKPSFKFDDNDNLVRPDPVGVFKQHEVNAYYVGIAGDGHIGRINITNQFYIAMGNDSANPIGGTSQQIEAQMAAIELSYDRDWIRFRTSYFFASGDDDPNDGIARGFDTIVDDPIFAGGEFSYWQRQSIKLFGTNLVQRKSIVPNLRSSKQQGQSNFVNPGLHLFNVGTDIEVTPKSRIVANANYLYFDETEVLKTYTFQDKINREIGTDLSIGMEYRPRLNDNAIFVFGVATLLPGSGLDDLFGTELPPELAAIGVGDELQSETPQFTSAFFEVVLAY